MNFSGKKSSGGASGSDSRFFTTTKKGEMAELRSELTHSSQDRRRDAVKKVIANMTVGKDVSTLFPDVVNCISTTHIELKKLVYLYLINYAKTQPELALLAVNAFVIDAADPNPLIRALAVRTMGCIRVESITEYLCEPLARCLRDDDPYVRKTAAICVAKLYDISAELVEDRGFMDTLRDLVADSNPTVIANAVAALAEIAEASGRDVMMVTTGVLQKLLAALNECTEWGQVFILDSLARYRPGDAREAESIVERVIPRLQHANSAVVLSAVKVVLSYLDLVTDADAARAITRKLAPPLVTLLNSEPEVQYVALRNINLIVQKRPRILEHEIKVFFAKYNDPIYVKMEKLEIIIRLVNERNVDQVLLEFKEYATEVDVDFVRRAVRAIGRCAIKLERAAQKCINVLLELIQTKVNYVVQEAIIVTKDIFRRYPNRYEQIIGTLCENLESLDEPEAKASMVWIIGEYADQIDNADELLDSFLETFEEESAPVQLQLLTATVKLFLKQPEDTQELVQRVLNMATEDSDNPDLRDRGFVYWRLLSTNPDAARAVVLADKPTIADDTFTLDPALLDGLISQIASLSAIYHKPADAFVMRAATNNLSDDEDEDEPEYIDDHSSSAAPGGGSGGPVDLLDMGAPAPAPAPAAAAAAVDLFGAAPAQETPTPPAAPAVMPLPPKTLVCPATAQSQGIAIAGCLAQRNGQLGLVLDVNNSGAAPVTKLAVQFNKNPFGIAPATPQIQFATPVAQGATSPTTLPLTLTPAMVTPGPPAASSLQIALKNLGTGAVFYFAVPIKFWVLFSPNGQMDKSSFIQMWKGIPDDAEVYSMVPNMGDIAVVQSKLAMYNVFPVARLQKDGQDVAYFSMVTVTKQTFCLELTWGAAACKVCVKTDSGDYATLAKQAVEEILSS